MSLQFVGKLDQIYTGAEGSVTARWLATDFIDKVLFANASIAPVYWPGSGLARPLPGLPDDTAWDGVHVVAGHAVLWRGATLKHSGLNDLALWVPVGTTAVSGRALVSEAFTQIAVGSVSPWIFLSGVSGSFVAKQYVRIVSNESDPQAIKYDYFIVDSVALGSTSPAIDTAKTIAVGETDKVFLISYALWPKESALTVSGEDTDLLVTNSARDLIFTTTTEASSSVIPAVGGQVSLPLSDFPATLKVGDFVSVGDHEAVGLDIYEVVTIGQVLQVKRTGEGTERFGEGLTFPSGTHVTFQHWVEVENVGTDDVEIDSGSDITVRPSLKLIPQGFTGATAEAVEIPVGAVVETLDANEAGETINVGAEINGDIFAVTTLGEYGYILKQDSIQSMQYVGISNGTFFIRPEIGSEGPVSKYAWCRFGENQLAFWGQKGFFQYGGGQLLTTICDQHSNEVFEEVDSARVDEIVAFHDKPGYKVWFVYPVVGSDARKVLIYNYQEGTCVVDDYDEELGGITAVGGVDWEVAPTWESLPVSELWNSQDKRWNEFVDEGLKRQTIIAIAGDDANTELGETSGEKIPRLLLHGRGFSRLSRQDCGRCTDTPTVVGILGDPHDANAGEQAMAAMVLAWNPDGVVSVGDNGLPSDADNIEDVLAPFNDLRDAGRAVSAVGNHDYEPTDGVSSTLDSFLAYFSNQPGNKRYFRKQFGNQEYFVVNPGWNSTYTGTDSSFEPDGFGLDSVQHAWFVAALASSTARWKIVVVHFPPYVSYILGTTTLYPGYTHVRTFLGDLQSMGVDLVLSGHAHCYERILVDDLNYVVLGFSGHPILRQFALAGPVVAGSVIRYPIEPTVPNYGATKLTSTDTTLRLDAQLIDGTIVDTLTLTKSGADCADGGYLCLAETADLDCGDSVVWKYTDLVQIGLKITNRLQRSSWLKVQLGGRDNLDSDIRWTAPAKVDVSGNANPITKADLRCAGRYIRARFFSDDPDVRWEITFYRIIFRKGAGH